MKNRLGAAAVAACWCLLLPVPVPCAAATLPPGLIDHPVRPSKHIEASPRLLELGRVTYERQCAPCHGSAGDGQGEAAYLLYPKPRDFTRGEFRLISTWDGIPTDEDLYRTISRGMPGSAMPSWSHLPEETRWALVHHVKSLSARPLQPQADAEPTSPNEPGAGLLRVPPRPASSAGLRAKGRELFLQGCAPCHGETAQGDGQQQQRDSEGYPTRPRDLTQGIFKGLPEPEELYKRIVLGLPGSPMPTSPYLHGDDGWALTEYVFSLSSPRQREKAEMKRFRIVAHHTAELPQHPDSSAWREAAPVELHLMPLWWRPARPEVLTVKALHDGNVLALLLQWADETDDSTAMRPQDFRDAAAVELSPVDDPPFFGMGEAGQEVSIWMWKAERQADMQAAFRELETVYPYLGIDSYPNLARSPLEQPLRHALTLDSDPTFITAWGAGNIVADPTRRSAVESLTAAGFGTLRSRPVVDQQVRATGTFVFGSYQVIFVREMRGGVEDSQILAPGKTIPVSFAVWDGSAGDRDGKKSVTIWQELHIEAPAKGSGR